MARQGIFWLPLWWVNFLILSSDQHDSIFFLTTQHPMNALARKKRLQSPKNASMFMRSWRKSSQTVSGQRESVQRLEKIQQWHVSYESQRQTHNWFLSHFMNVSMRRLRWRIGSAFEEVWLTNSRMSWNYLEQKAKDSRSLWVTHQTSQSSTYEDARFDWAKFHNLIYAQMSTVGH
jgi:hypothetical protein